MKSISSRDGKTIRAKQCYGNAVRRLLNVALFLDLVNELTVQWRNTMWTPMQLLDFLFDARVTPLRHSAFQVLVIVALFMGGSKARTGRVALMDRLIKLALVTIAVWWGYGMATGGDFKASYTQVFNLMESLLFAIAIARHNRTPEHFFKVGQVVVYAAAYRATFVIIYYVVYVRGLVYTDIPQHLSTHGDTVLFVDALLILVAYALSVRTKKVALLLLAAVPLILVAIQLNNRRLAWASLAGGLVVLYAVLPAGGRITRAVNRKVMWVAPVLALYVMVGLGRTERIFKPLASLSTMGGGKIDASTQARDNENEGLVTMVGLAPLAGTGWGHKWLELDNSLGVPETTFPMYHYICHNNVLIIIAYTGFFGFVALWLPLPVSVYLNTRTYRTSTSPLERAAAMSGACMVVVTVNQFWGDMGVMDINATYLGALAYAAATRLPVTSGVWRSGLLSKDPARAPESPAVSVTP